MAVETKARVVDVTWKVDIRELKEADNLARLHITTIKKLNQVHGQLAKQTDILAQSYQHAVQASQAQLSATQQLIASNEQSNEVLVRQNMAMMQMIATIVENTSKQRQNTQVTNENTMAKEENNKVLNLNNTAWLKNARTLVFWTIGAASTYRLVIKIRREIINTVKALTENTEEYERLVKSTNLLKAALLNIVGPQETWLKSLDTVATSIRAVGAAYAWFISASAGLLAGLVEAYEDVERAVDRVNLRIAEWQGNEQAIKAINEHLKEMGPNLTIIEAMSQGFEEMWKNIFETERILTGKPEIDAGKKGTAWEQRREQAERYNDYMEALVDAEQQRIEELVDLWRDYQDKLKDIGTDVQRAMDDMTLKGARKRQDIETDYQRRLQDIERQAQDNRAKAEEQYRIRLIRIEMQYREKLIRIEENFQDAMYDAIAKRDATAALRAMRVRERDTSRAERERNDARELARLNYEAQVNDQQRALERMREDARIARQRALEDLRIDQERERQDILLDQARKEADLQLYWDRRRADIESEYNQEIQKARAQYLLDESEYRNHLKRKLGELQSYYQQVVKLYNTYSGFLATPMAPGLGSPKLTGKTTTKTGETASLAEGGAIVASGPTNISVAERSPELIVAQPLMPSSHTFSGSMRHSVYGQVEGAFAGMEGRISAAVTSQVMQVFQDILQ